jgi:hypothetical protein
MRERLEAIVRGPERLLPFACIAAAVVLFASELLTTFEFKPPGGDPLCTQAAIDRHAFAPALLALAAIVATGLAVFTGSKPAAVGVAVCGLVALAIFLLLDLPDANNVGTVDDSCGATVGTFFDAEAVPRPGFWLELIGSLALAISGAALASLTPDQLRSLRPGPIRGPGMPASGVGAEPDRSARDGRVTDGARIPPREPAGERDAAGRRERGRR